MGAKCRQYVVTMSCLLSSVACGCCFVWLNPILHRLHGPNSEVPMTPSESSWIVASIEFAGGLSAIPIGLLADRLGRKMAILSAGPLLMASWVFIILFRTVWALLVARLLQGCVVSVVYCIAPAYIAEIATPKYRGELCGHMLTTFYLGYMCSYTMGPYLSYKTYAYICSVLPMIFTIIFVFMPETPYFLLMVKKREEAERHLKWLRAKPDVSEELSSMEISVEQDMKRKNNWKDLVATNTDRKALVIVQLAVVVKYFTGNVTVVSYSTEMFAKSSGALSKDVLTIIMGSILLLSSFGAAFIADAVGRRTLLVSSALGCAFFSGAACTYYFFLENTNFQMKDYTWIMNVAIIGYCVVNSMGLGPLVPTIQAEYFPSHTRGVGAGVSGLTSGLSAFIALKTYQPFTDAVGVWFNYLLYSFFGVVGAILFCLVLSETSGKTLGEIQKDILESSTQPRKA